MKKNLSGWIIGLCGAAVAVLSSSCAYDPYYSSSYGYNDGYYGGGSYSTSVFVSTGNSRWGYDPYCHSYYDYTRRAYYDPYLYGYYPVGYRPPIIIGVPHPGGWYPGHGHCPPPRRVVDHRISDYRNREALYRRSDYSWSNQVRQREAGRSVDTDRIRRVDGNDRSQLIRNSQGGGRDRSPGNVTRPTDRSPNNFTRPTDRSPSDWNRDRGGNDRSPMVRPDRNDSNRFTPPQRGGSERTPSQRPSFNTPERSRERSSPRYSPSGFNNPVAITPDRGSQRSERPQMQERSAPQMRERSAPQAREAPSREFSRPERSSNDSDSSGGGRSSRGGGDGEGRRGR